jgi:hypothetical protein
MSTGYRLPAVEHLVMLGPDWWACLCGDVDGGFPRADVERFSLALAARVGGVDVISAPGWTWVSLGPHHFHGQSTGREIHRRLWEAGVCASCGRACTPGAPRACPDCAQ